MYTQTYHDFLDLPKEIFKRPTLGSDELTVGQPTRPGLMSSNDDLQHGLRLGPWRWGRRQAARPVDFRTEKI